MRRSTLLLLCSGLVVGLLLPTASSARTINVHRGQSIQKAVNRAHDGDRIFIHPGTYRERGKPCPTEAGDCAVVIKRDDISLIGRPQKHRPVVLQARGDQHQGIAVARSDSPASCLTDPDLRVDESLIANIDVTGFEGDGVFLSCVDRWRVTNVTATDNLEYGIFPQYSGNGRIDHSFASGSNDTGIYVGQDHDVRVDHNTATDNVSGYEIENSTAVVATDNQSFGNTGGLLSFTLPGLLINTNHDNEVANNNIHDNDRANTCVDPTDAVCSVPPGTGILLLAADTNNVHNNTVTGNDTFGIAVANFCTGNAAACNPPPTDIDLFPDGNHIVSNTATGNGTNPDPDVPGIFAVDLAWDFTGTGNCWSNNTAGTAFPSNLPPCP